MVGADGVANGVQVLNVVAGADELLTAQGDQIAEFRIGTVVEVPACVVGAKPGKTRIILRIRHKTDQPPSLGKPRYRKKFKNKNPHQY